VQYRIEHVKGWKNPAIIRVKDKYFRRVDAIDNLWNAAIDLLDERYGKDGWDDL